MAVLILDRSGRRETFSFPGATITIGRGDDNDLRIASRFVSQHHCRIEAEGDGVYLLDLDSQNGTLVNGNDVSKCRLKPGDRIEIGSVALWFERVPEESTAVIAGTGSLEVTAGLDEEVQISARGPASVAGKLSEALSAALLEYRKAFGDERGLLEVEQNVVECTRRLFPRPAFQRSLEAARLVEFTRAINSTTDVTRVLTMIMDAAVELTDSERGFLVLRDEQGGWRVRVARNLDLEAVKAPENKMSRSIAEQVARLGKPICSVNAQSDQRFGSFHSVSELKLRSVACVPLIVKDRVTGTIYLDNRFKDGVYTDRELHLLETLADHAALAVENAQLYERNTETERQLAAKTAELEDLEGLLSSRLRETTAANVADPKVLNRSGLKHEYSMIIGESPAMIEMFRLLDRVIESDLPILVMGESGTGKELVASAVHHNSNRKTKTFVRENCAAIPASLLESELFGYVKGAFTGAAGDRKGLFEQADGGTIFLDEIGEMSIDMQAKLLRVLQNGEIRPVGAREVRRVDVRLISATNRNLREMVDQGKFREDLFFRLNVICIDIPPLRARSEDISLLIEHFLSESARRTGGVRKEVDPLAMRYLLSYHWPGNIRELQNEIQRAVALSGGAITMDDLSKEVLGARQLTLDVPSGSKGLKDMVKLATFQKEREIILRTLEEAEWNKSLAAKRLDISRPTLDQKIRLFGLTPFIERGRQRD